MPGYLNPDRATEIAEGVLRSSFPCHQTIAYDEESSTAYETLDSQQCAGALIVLARQGFTSQLSRIAERLGQYDEGKLDMDAPVFDSLDDFRAHHGVVFRETCNTVDMYCEAPAGYAVGGGVTRGEGLPVDEMVLCPDCYEYCCSTCATSVEEDGEVKDVCGTCAGYYEEDDDD